MKNIKLPVILASIIILVYMASLLMNWNVNFSLLLYAIFPIALIWMVIRVLKDGEPSDFTFEERFYEDNDYRRK